MPISIVLTEEDGEELERVEDPLNRIHHLLTSVDDGSYHYLPFIDPYGDTIFNQIQMEPFREEWRRLETAATAPEDLELLAQIHEMARKCQQEPHLYLKFVGD